MNANGEVVGLSPSSDSSLHAFVWSQGGGMVDLGTLGGNSSRATAISSTGQVVGQSGLTTNFLPLHGFSWTRAGGMIDLGASTTNALVVNSSGQVTGELILGPGVTHAYSWTPAGGLEDLGTLGSGYIASSPTGLSESGDRWVQPHSGRSQPRVRMEPRRSQIDLGTLEGDAVSASVANAVSDTGRVVGSDQANVAIPSHAFSWTATGGMVDLGTLGARLAPRSPSTRAARSSATVQRPPAQSTPCSGTRADSTRRRRP
jgi:probable HAF family extracellular repeat protein